MYETLRFGTSLAQRTKKSSSGSGSDSPHRTSVIASSSLGQPAVVPGRAGLEHHRARQEGSPGSHAASEGGSRCLGALKGNVLWPAPREPQRPHSWPHNPDSPLCASPIRQHICQHVERFAQTRAEAGMSSCVLFSFQLHPSSRIQPFLTCSQSFLFKARSTL